jgi:hypothetical protein
MTSALPTRPAVSPRRATTGRRVFPATEYKFFDALVALLHGLTDDSWLLKQPPGAGCAETRDRKMWIRNAILSASLACAMLSVGAPSAHAFIGTFILIDSLAKKEAKVALATPGHAEWCAQQHPGYRKQWNNYLVEGGRVQFCASPYYTPPWMKFGFNRSLQ